jgi:hypothetical protein
MCALAIRDDISPEVFAGSDEGAENLAMLASLIESCKLHGVNQESGSISDRHADQARQQLAQ